MVNQGSSHTPLSPGRPKSVLDEDLLRELKELGYGAKRLAREYIERTGQYVSHMTVRERLKSFDETERPKPSRFGS